MPIAGTMPNRSAKRPVMTPPMPKPNIASVKASDAAPREPPNSACTFGNATTTDHMPTLPTAPIASAINSRRHAAGESGTNGGAAPAGDKGMVNEALRRHGHGGLCRRLNV